MFTFNTIEVAVSFFLRGRGRWGRSGGLDCLSSRDPNDTFGTHFGPPWALCGAPKILTEFQSEVRAVQGIQKPLPQGASGARRSSSYWPALVRRGGCGTPLGGCGTPLPHASSIPLRWLHITQSAAPIKQSIKQCIN